MEAIRLGIHRAFPYAKLYGYQKKNHRLQQQQQVIQILDTEPIIRLLRELYLRGPNTVGIFRKSPSAKHCRELRQKLEADGRSSIDEFQVTVIASVLKEWLRSLPDCLLMSHLYFQWIDVAKLIDPLYQHQFQDGLLQRHGECLRIVRQLLEVLDESNLILLRSLICVLWHIASNSDFNKMSSSNLGVCIGQSLLNYDSQKEEGSKASRLIKSRRRRHSRSQSLFASTLSLNGSWSSSNSSSHFSEPQGAQECAKYVPILVAFMIDNATSLFGQDITDIFTDQHSSSPTSSSFCHSDSPTSSASSSFCHSDSPASSEPDSSQRHNTRTDVSTSFFSPSIGSAWDQPTVRLIIFRRFNTE